jgi:hypothetical protein
MPLTTHWPRRHLIVAIVALALVVVACGGSASPSPTAASPTAAPTPSATPTPTPTPEPTGSAEPGGDGPDLSGAAAALDALTGYQLDISISGVLPAASGATGITMSALVDRENEAADFTMSGFEGLPTAGAGLRVILIGDDAWLDLGTGTFVATPGGASTYSGLVDSLSPSALLGDLQTDSFSALPAVGQEQKNGVATTHYHADGSNPLFGARFGPEGMTDVWIANDGGFLVSMTVSGTTDVDGAPTQVAMSIDLSRIDDPTIDIQPPS